MYKATYDIQAVKPSKLLFKGDNEICYKPISERITLEKEYSSLEMLKEKMQEELNQFLSLYFSLPVTVAIDLIIEENGEYCDSEELFCVFSNGKTKLKDVVDEELEKFNYLILLYGLRVQLKDDVISKKEKEMINSIISELARLLNKYIDELERPSEETTEFFKSTSYVDILHVLRKKIEQEKIRKKQPILDKLYSLQEALWKYSY